jgi:hypothetical protein
MNHRAFQVATDAGRAKGEETHHLSSQGKTYLLNTTLRIWIKDVAICSLIFLKKQTSVC